MPTSPRRVAANCANARKSTGPRTPEGKARSSQNARKHPFNPDPFAIVRIEDRAAISTLVADAIATYQPINSQERDAVERIALAKHSMRRMAILEAGFFSNCLDQAMAGPADPFILNRSELAKGIDIPLEQHRAYWLAFGFNCFNRQSNIGTTFLRFQAQAERLYRRAVEDFHRLLKLRGELPPEKYEEPIEPNIEPILTLQPTENTAATDPPPVPQPENEPIAEPSPEPVTQPEPQQQEPAAPHETPRTPDRPENHPRPVLVLKKQPRRATADGKRQAAKSRPGP
jgi:hypothetical protein